MLLLFEGGEEDNESQVRHISSSVTTLSVQQLEQMGKELQQMGLVDSVHVLPTAHPAHQIFNVHGQCLYLVRPDAYVGLRSDGNLGA